MPNSVRLLLTTSSKSRGSDVMKSTRYTMMVRSFGLSLILASGVVWATPIEFIHTGTGSGTIGATSFTNAAFTITEFSDTSSRQSCGGGCFFIDDAVATIAISGVRTFTFLTRTRTFVNQAISLIRFSRAGAGRDVVVQLPAEGGCSAV